MIRGINIVRGSLAAIAALWTSRVGSSAAAALLAIFLPALSAAYGPGGEEDRCAELGSRCVCAESLNASDDITNGAHGAPNWNPSNSTQKQCGTRDLPHFYLPYSALHTVAQVRSSDAGVPFPSGANPYIHRSALSGHNDNVHSFYAADLANVSNETICNRHYFRLSPGWGTCSNSSHRLKTMGIGHLTGATSVNGGPQLNCPGTGMYASSVNSDYDRSDFQDFIPDLGTTCASRWCRLEVCLDLTGANLQFRHRVTVLGGPVYQSSNNQGTGPSTNSWLADLSVYTQGNISSGYQYRSHLLVARAPYNPNFWIGPAYELESGSGATTPPPPPPPAVPAPPVLLPPE